MRNLNLVLVLLIFAACGQKQQNNDQQSQLADNTANDNPLIYPEETHFKSLRQITFGGDNAEAYWSFDDQQLLFQSNNSDWGVGCDQMFLMNFDYFIHYK